jgi:[acyl-carrier-protein] S-malonyltransferase
MKSGLIFSGQGSQFAGMGIALIERYQQAQYWYDQARELLGFDLGQIMQQGSGDDLRQTAVTQPAIYLYSTIVFNSAMPTASAVAGHSLGEYTALAAAGVFTFQEGLQLVNQRAKAMQAACEQNVGTMAAVLGLADDAVREACARVDGHVVVPANQNCPGQLVISGDLAGIAAATILLKEAGAKRVLPLQVGGAFHSPLMEPARAELQAAIASLAFKPATIPVYQNLDGKPSTDPELMKHKLEQQMTSAVLWADTLRNMAADGVTEFAECGPGATLQGLVKKTLPEARTLSVA